MKTLANRILRFTSIFVLISMQQVFSQNEPITKMSYEVTSGPVFPIDGESLQMKGQLGLNDSTGEIESLAFQVPLISFIGSHGGYLAWLGNARENPDLNFRSNSINKKKDYLEVNGQLEFRRRFRPITMNITRKDVDGEIVLEGNFQISTSDYFFGPTPPDLVAAWIPIKFMMVFDKPDIIIEGKILNTN